MAGRLPVCLDVVVLGVGEATLEVVVEDNALVVGGDYVAGSERELPHWEDEVELAQDYSNRKV